MTRFALICLLGMFTSPVWAITGASLSLKTGNTSGSSAQLLNNGYAGTYVTLDAPGSVLVRVNAHGTSFGDIDPHLNLVINDESMGWDIGSSAEFYEHSFDLPAGTHLVRAEFNNDQGTSRSMLINALEVSGDGVTLEASNTNALALEAADDYIENYRRGQGNVALVGVSPGTEVQLKLKRHAFNFGVGIPNSFTDTFLVPPDSPGADPGAAQFQQALVDNRFNSLTPGNAGKWDANEGTRDVVTTKQPPAYAAPYVYMDRIAEFAADHNMGYRAHNLIWGHNTMGNNNQQPTWVHNMLNNSAGTDTYHATNNPQGTNLSNKDALFSDLVAPEGTPNAGEASEIHERIKYYVEDRAQEFYEIDVFNESYHTGANNPGSSNTYWDHYGASGVAKIYQLVRDAIEDGGGNAGVFVNEYSVLQQEGGDYYANWYARHIESIQNAGMALPGNSENVVTGIGIQYYASTNLANHVAARIYATLHNLAVQGLPMSLTEFGVLGTDSPTNEDNAAIVLAETLRLVFGMPGTTGFTQWDLRNSGAFAPVGTFYNADWSERDPGLAWRALMEEWDTDVTTTVNADGTIDFTGFYGQYEVTVDGQTQTFDMDLTKGTSLYSLQVAPGDYNGDGTVNAADFTVWRDSLGSSTDFRADGDGNRVIDDADYGIWKSLFGTVYLGGGATATVPEPATMSIASLAAVFLLFTHRRSNRCRRSSGSNVTPPAECTC